MSGNTYRAVPGGGQLNNSDSNSLEFEGVRDAIKRIGGTLPENIPPAEHFKQVKKQVKTAAPKLTLDKHEAGGLVTKLPR